MADDWIGLLETLGQTYGAYEQNRSRAAAQASAAASQIAPPASMRPQPHSMAPMQSTQQDYVEQIIRKIIEMLAKRGQSNTSSIPDLNSLTSSVFGGVMGGGYSGMGSGFGQ